MIDERDYYFEQNRFHTWFDEHGFWRHLFGGIPNGKSKIILFFMYLKIQNQETFLAFDLSNIIDTTGNSFAYG